MKIMSATKNILGMIILPALFSGTVLAQETYPDYDYEQDNAVIIDKTETYAVDDSTEVVVDKAEAYAVDTRGDLWRNATGLCWHTGYWTPAMAIFECDPELVKLPEKIVEAPPEPIPVPVTAPEKVTLSSDALFDFDSAKLKPEGEQALDDFVAQLHNVQYDLIVAVGHTDRIGAEEYNKKLSVRRAESVKEYLVANKGIEATRIFTDGKGEANPVTGDTCQGKRGNTLIACLQPDRRVEIEVAGTR